MLADGEMALTQMAEEFKLRDDLTVEYDGNENVGTRCGDVVSAMCFD